MPVEREVTSIFCGTNGYLDDVAETEVARFESEFLQYLDRNHAELLSEIAETGLLGDEQLETLHAAVKAFKENWSDTPPQAQVQDADTEAEEAPVEGE